MKLKPFVLLAFVLALCSSAFCQPKKDTIYYDEDWSICEKPVAEYYRVCELNRDSIFFYKGEVKDYFIDGRLEMTGDYANGNNKNGEFIFYNKTGKIIKKGDFLNNVMMGDWYFYDSLGRLRSQFFCKTQFDFTPVLLINNYNDTLLKNGSGEFVLNNVTNYPYIRSRFGCMIKGKVHNGVKDGEFKYYNYPKKHLLYNEKYEDGRFVKSKWLENGYYGYWMQDRLFILSLSDLSLEKTDAFYHSNMVFGEGRQGLQKLINFLSYDIPPQISASSNIDERDKICFNIIFKILDDKFLEDSIYVITSDIEDGNNSEKLSTSNITISQLNALPKLHGDITLTVDTIGAISDCIFKTNLPDDDVHKLDYYLKHVSGLPIAHDKGEKTSRTLNLQLNTIIDTQKNNLFVVNYLLNNPKAFVPIVDAPKVSGNYYKEFTSVQTEAKFPGDWNKFLERNLNAQTPADHSAPPGRYSVTVSFLVDTTGNISEVIAENDPGYGTAQEAVRVIKNGPNWQPAIQNGRKVFYRQKQTIVFEVMKF